MALASAFCGRGSHVDRLTIAAASASLGSEDQRPTGVSEWYSPPGGGADRVAGGVTGEDTGAVTVNELLAERPAVRIGALQSQLTQILVARENASPGVILTPTYLLDDPVGPKPLRAAATGGMVGLVLAAGLVALFVRQKAPEDAGRPPLAPG